MWAPLPSGLPAKEGPDSAGLCPAVHPFPPRREWGSISHAALPSPSRGKPEFLTLFILSDGEKKYAERSERGGVVAPSLGAFSCVFISSIPRWYQHEQATHRRAQQPGLGSSFSSLAPCVCAAAAVGSGRLGLHPSISYTADGMAKQRLFLSLFMRWVLLFFF